MFLVGLVMFLGAASVGLFIAYVTDNLEELLGAICLVGFVAAVACTIGGLIVMAASFAPEKPTAAPTVAESPNQ